MTKLRAVAMAMAGVVLFAGAVEAQLCTGRSLPGELGAFGNFGTTEGLTRYGVSVGANLQNGVGFGLSYDRHSVDGSDEGINGFGLEGSYALNLVPAVAMCPMLSVSHMGADGASRTDFVGAFGVSYPVQVNPGVRVVPFIAPGILHARAAIDFGGSTISDSETALAVTLGAGAIIQRFTVQARVSMTSLDGDEPWFNLGLGYRVPMAR